MTISALPTPPSRAAAPDTFASQADALLGALPAFVTEANALQADINAKQITASTAAATAVENAGIATTKAGEATSAAGTADAARIAAESARNAAAGYRDNAAISAGQAAAAALSASNAADACAGLVAGISDGPVTSVNGKTGIVTLDIRIPTYTYDARSDLRSLTPSDGDQAIVDGLGLFVFFAGSDEPDDDESCFATAAGRWLLEAAHWDVVSMWQLPDDAVRDEYDEDEHLRFASSFASKVLSGTATCAITYVASISSVSFAGTVTGASVGDRVIATPPAQLGESAVDTGCLSYHAWVSAANTVTVMLTNASAVAAANTNAAIRTAWPITVIKS